jgi:hypothetical protein
VTWRRNIGGEDSRMPYVTAPPKRTLLVPHVESHPAFVLAKSHATRGWPGFTCGMVA